MRRPPFVVEGNCLTRTKKTPNWLWHSGDRSLKHDVLIMLPQHCQNVTAPQHVADKGDAGGPGTLGQSIWKAAKDFGGMGEFSLQSVWCNNGRLTKSFLHFEVPLICNGKDKFHTFNIKASLLLTNDRVITCNKRFAKSEEPTQFYHIIIIS